MKKLILLVSYSLISCTLLASNTALPKGSLFIYWGWNGSNYTTSNLNLQGTDYNFTLHKLKATDRQSPLSWDYLNPGLMTIPQYNFRIGYAFKNNWSLSLAMDHMKYVMVQDQSVHISGNIQHPTSPIKGNNLDQYISVGTDLLIFEHTDGLNNLNIELRHHKNVYHIPLDKKNRGITLGIEGGIGAGIMIPKTNAQLFQQKRHDEFHLSGGDIHGVLGGKITFWKYAFILSEFKAGYIAMPNIRTTYSKTDKASQNFGYIQYNIVFGLQYKF